jgi:hypothetical protein
MKMKAYACHCGTDLIYTFVGLSELSNGAVVL